MASAGPRMATVFIVDDDDSVRKSLKRLMLSEGIQALAYETPERFLREVVPTPHACVLLDLTLPGMSGLDVQKRLNERGLKLPVIAVSACDDDATRLEARQLGALFFFRKPVDDRTLIDAIDWATSYGP